MKTQAPTAATNETIYPIYVVHGKDRRRAVDKQQEIVGQVLGEADPQTALHTYEGGEAVLTEVLDDLRTLPFLSERRVVVVKDADPFISENREQLEKYLNEPARTGVLVLQADSFPSNTRVAKQAAKIGKVFAYQPIQSKELGVYLINYARQHHQLQLDREAAEMLIELAGDESSILMNELDKLAAYLDGGEKKRGRITPTEVEELVGSNRRYDAFNVIDAMAGGKGGEALELLDRMLSQDREAEFKAVGAFAWHFRRLYQGRILLEKGVGEGGIIGQLRVWYQKSLFIQNVRQLSLRELGSCLQELMSIDANNKMGAGTVKSGLEKFIMEFCRGREQAKQSITNKHAYTKTSTSSVESK